ncbi:hypothetical protein JT359_02160 [Candidatus Poribacteria bacterium]|nr:hypothetical protein [Candidatus Poribacteria bacterium]
MKNNLQIGQWMFFILFGMLMILYVQDLNSAQGRGKIYWTEDGQIKRSNLNGSVVESVVIGLESRGDIVLDLPNSKMYWVDFWARKIQRANLDGTHIEDIVTGFRIPNGEGGIRINCNNEKCKAIATPKGGVPIEVPQELLNAPSCIAIDHQENKIYWGNRNLLGIFKRADLDGSNVEEFLRFGLMHSSAVNVELDVKVGKMYWTDDLHDQNLRANLDASDTEMVVNDMLEPHGLALDLHARKMYWSITFQGTIQRSDLNGNNIENIVTGLSFPQDIALDMRSRKIYWVDQDRKTFKSKIQRANLDGSNVTDILTDLGSIGGIALDLHNQYAFVSNTNKLTTIWANMKKD